LRYKLLNCQLECATRFENALKAADFKNYADEAARHEMLHGLAEHKGILADLRSTRIEFADWYAKSWNDSKLRDQSKLKELQDCLAAVAERLFVKILVPAWRLESEELLPCSAAGESSSNTEDKKEENKIHAGALHPSCGGISLLRLCRIHPECNGAHAHAGYGNRESVHRANNFTGLLSIRSANRGEYVHDPSVSCSRFSNRDCVCPDAS
jgi:hypothetical protein